MNHTRRVKGLLVFLITLAIGGLLPAGSPQTRRMVSLVQVQVNQAVMPMNSETLRTLLYCDAVAGRAARDVLSVDFDPDIHLFTTKSVASDQPDVLQLAVTINLPVTVDAAAVEFEDALAQNLRGELKRSFDTRIEYLEERLSSARLRVERATDAFNRAVVQSVPAGDELISLDPADELIYRQLDETVDLSSLNHDMSFREAVQMLRRSVDPPLKIVVLWKDLSDNAEIEPATQVDIDGLGVVRLGAGLKNLLNAVAGGFTRLDYVVDDGVVTVATIDSLPATQMEAYVHRVPARLRSLAQTNQIIRTIMEAVEPESWYDLTEFGTGTIRPLGDTELLIWQTRPNHRKIQQLLRQVARAPLALLSVDASPEMLTDHLRLLISYRDKLQAEANSIQKGLTELQRSRADTEERYHRNSWNAVHKDLIGVLGALDALKAKIADGTSDPPVAEEIDGIIRQINACMERSNEHPPVRPPGGFPCLGPLWPASTQEQALAARLRSQRATLETVTSRIGELDRRLVGPQLFDPEAVPIRFATERLQSAMAHTAELETLLLEAEAPVVTILGATQ